MKKNLEKKKIITIKGKGNIIRKKRKKVKKKIIFKGFIHVVTSIVNKC